MPSKLLSVAIDFGTTYSGYAFSFRHEKDKVYTYEWDPGNGNVPTLKTPTSVLFDSRKQFHSFGYEAEKKYVSLSEHGEEKEWFFFKKFKMSLFKEQNLHQWSTVKDFTGREMLTMTVFSACIKYLKEHLTVHFSDKTRLVSAKDIQWVLTVPAIWSDAAKQFMRRAAEQAGIPGDQLSLALEPEAAALWCRTAQKIARYQVGSQFMVVDCGGGTVDITVHQVQANGKLKEKLSPTGGAWGGVKVDDGFQEFLLEICSLPAIRQMTKQEVLQLEQDFESLKKNVDPYNLPAYYSIKIPVRLRQNITAEAVLCGKVKIIGDKLRIPGNTVIGFFKYPIKKIKGCLREIFGNPTARQTSKIYLVGGFSECKVLQHAVQEEFQDAVIYTPSEAVSAVLKGAVLFGHDSGIIGWRIAPYTYGLGCCTDFDYREHDVRYKFVAEGVEKCNNIFSKFVLKGDTVENGYRTPAQIFRPLYTGATSISIPVYICTERDPFYTIDAGCRYLGSMSVLMPDTTGEKSRKVKVQMIFGGTELKVEATDGNTGKLFSSSFDYV